MESYQFSSTFTVITELLKDVDNSKGQNFELCHCFSKQAIYTYIMCVYIIYIYIYMPISYSNTSDRDK